MDALPICTSPPWQHPACSQSGTAHAPVATCSTPLWSPEGSAEHGAVLSCSTGISSPGGSTEHVLTRCHLPGAVLQFCQQAAAAAPGGRCLGRGVFLPPKFVIFINLFILRPHRCRPRFRVFGVCLCHGGGSHSVCAAQQQKVSIWGNQPQIGVGKGQGGRGSF